MKKILLVFLILSAFSLEAQKLLELRPEYNIEEDPFFEGIDQIPEEELGTWSVVEKISSLEIEHETITVDVEPGIELTFSREDAFVDSLGILKWFGVNSDAFNYPNSIAHFEMYEDKLKGYVSINDSEAYQFFDIENDHFISMKVDINDECDTDLVPYFEAPALKHSAPQDKSLHCGGLRIYRMIIAYTPQFYNSFPSANRQKLINVFLRDVVDKTNQTYINSNTNVRVRLALSYQTHNELGNKGSDLTEFSKHNSSGTGRYDEVWNLKTQYRADVLILLVNYNQGGRADRQNKTAVYGKNAAGWNYGVAHEVGHMFDLDHNREQFTWVEQKWLDGKKRYGFRGWNGGYRSVMSYGTQQTRYPLYSDPNLYFPNGQGAGNSKAKARNYLQGHLSNVFQYNDPIDLHMVGRKIFYNQTTSRFAYNSIKLTNTLIEIGAEANYKAENFIELLPGTTIEQGATANFEIEDCQNSQVFRKRGNEDLVIDSEDHFASPFEDEISVYPNPTNDDVTLKLTFSEEKAYTINVYDAMGKSVFQFDGKSDQINQLVPLNQFNSGFYFLRLSMDDKVITKTIVKN